MSDNKNNSTSSGIGFVGLLSIVFIVLKLTKVIGWSWWWVLSPIWMSVGLWIFIFLVSVILGFAIYFVNKD